MASKLVDIVNLNADASCLEACYWLKVLNGGTGSKLYRLFETYVRYGKKVTLGIAGATAADIAIRNPEVIDLINAHSQTFEVVYRPFAHDIAQLRSPEGFNENLRIGKETIDTIFRQVTPAYLPPEFMLTTEQLGELAGHGMECTFINSRRFNEETRSRLPDFPYRILTIFDQGFPCFPIDGRLTKGYLHALHFYDNSRWEKRIAEHPYDTVVGWRDGESPFFLPDGVEREIAWLRGETDRVERIFLREYMAQYGLECLSVSKHPYLQHYPVHSFSAWMREFRMLGYIERVRDFEQNLSEFSSLEKILWLQTINSDILSAVEKRSPVIQILSEGRVSDHTIWRTERHVEGEAFLHLRSRVADLATFEEMTAKYRGDRFAHFTKLDIRHKFLTDRGII